jgi:hypothetical protein
VLPYSAHTLPSAEQSTHFAPSFPHSVMEWVLLQLPPASQHPSAHVLALQGPPPPEPPKPPEPPPKPPRFTLPQMPLQNCDASSMQIPSQAALQQ